MQLHPVSSPRWPHGQGLAAATSVKSAGKCTAPRAAHHADGALLERLAQRLEVAARELADLVEEEHAAVREADLTGPGQPAAAADEAGA